VGSPFVHLHLHTEFSMLDGAARVSDVISRAAADGQPAVGITDHGNMYGVLDFYRAAREADLKPVIGCLLAGQEIVTADGVKAVEAIRVGDSVLTHRGRFRRVLRTMKREYDGRGYEVELTGNSKRRLRLTEEHPILVRGRDGRTEWQKPGEIVAGRPNRRLGSEQWNSWACLPRLTSDTTTIDVGRHLPGFMTTADGFAAKSRKISSKYEALNRWERIPAQLPLDEEVAYFLGLYVAEGCIGKRRGRPTGDLRLTFNSTESNYIEFVQAFLLIRFGIRARLHERPNRGSTEVIACSLPLAYFLRSLCGDGAHEKRVPEAVLRAPQYVRLAFLNGILDGDGKSWTKSNPLFRRNLKTASRSLAWGVRTLLADIGFWASVGTGTEQKKGGKRTRYFTVHYSSLRRYSWGLRDDSYVYRPIRRVNEITIRQTVYNFEVEEDNSYVSDVVLHNCEAYFTGDSRFDRPRRADHEIFHLTLLAETNAGYRNLIKVASHAYLDGFYSKPRMDFELLERHRDGLIATSGCLGGLVCQRVMQGDYTAARDAAARFRDILGRDSFFIELQDHGLQEQREVNPQLVKMARELDAPLLATNDSHYTHKEDAEAHAALLCVQTGATLDDPNRFKFDADEFYLKTAAEMRQLFVDYPEACDNTLLVAERADVEIEFGKPELPAFPVPEGHDEDSYLRELTLEGAKDRYGQSPPMHVLERLEFELGVIKDMGFSAYFLVVWDLVRYARSRGIRVGPGRGSAAGSCVAYCLRIVDIDPIRYDLLFERFLNPGRKQMPDIDMDFDERYRGELIKYAAQRYGWDRVAQIVTFSTIKARAAVRDASRVLGYPWGVGDRIAKLMPPLIMGRDTPLSACLEHVSGHEDGFKMAAELRALFDADPDAKRVIDVARGLEGLRRQDGIHAAAVVITREPLTEYLPIQRKPEPGGDIEDAPIVTQYEMHGVEDLGLLKMDFLGLRNLSVIERTAELIEASRGERIDIDAAQLDDDKTFEMLRRGDSIGVFQLEGGPMRALMRSLAPTTFEDVCALVALYRPGPMAANMHTDYADRKNGRKPVRYYHDDLREILEPTFGLCIYQEQLMRMAEVLAGYSLEEADNLRKATGKKIRSLIAKERSKFVEGCVAQGHSKQFGEEMFDIIEPFADYSFNKSHSVGYGLVAYQTAYLKANYPVEYLAALLTSVKTNKDQTAVYLNECRQLGIPVLVPDVNESESDFAVRDGSIRFGLSAVRNVGEGLVEHIVAARDGGGAFTDFFDFCERVDPQALNKRTIESLIKAGAFDSLGHPRQGHLHVFEQIVDLTLARRRERDAGIMSLFGGGEGAADDTTSGFDERVTIPETEFDKRDRLAHEKEMLGLYVSEHPLMGAERGLRRHTECTLTELKELREGEMRVVGGVVAALNRRYTKRGDLMATFVLEDLGAALEVMVFPKTMTSYGHVLQEDAIVCVKGRLDMRDDDPKIIAMEITQPELVIDGGPPVRLRVRRDALTNEKVEQLKEILHNHPGDSPVFVHLEGADRTTVLQLADDFLVDSNNGLYADLRVLLGANCVA
jgi:DNA polymerase III subunit alpha